MTGGGSTAVGLLACAYAVFALSTQWVWLRKHNTADGVFVYWVLCVSVYSIGVLSDFACGLPHFQPLAMLGGCIWALGTSVVVPTINTLGLGLAALLWGNVSVLVGWAVGRFGLPGVVSAASDVNPTLNYAGVAAVMIGSLFFAAIRPVVETRGDEGSPRLSKANSYNVTLSTIDVEGRISEMNGCQSARNESNEGEGGQSASGSKKMLGILGAMFVGTCAGFYFLPVTYIQEHAENFTEPPESAICYAHSHYTGILLTSTVIFVVYCIYNRNRPFTNPRTVLPALFAGLLWATGQLGWFVANDHLSQAVSYPINGTMPCVLAALWGVFYFQEIRGKRDFTLLTIAIAFTCVGVVLVGLSKLLV